MKTITLNLSDESLAVVEDAIQRSRNHASLAVFTAKMNLTHRMRHMRERANRDLPLAQAKLDALNEALDALNSQVSNTSVSATG